MYTALRLQRKLKRTEAEIIVVTPDPYMTYQPFLPEAAAGSISPRHVVVPLRRVLDRCTVVIGEARTIDHAKRTATISTLATEEEGTGAVEIAYDELVLAPGSVSRTLPVPGLADHGIGFKTVEEAIGLRNHVIEQMDIASSTRDPAVRDAALTFVFVGGGYAGVEALGELEDMARYATRYYHNIKPTDMKWILVEASGRILPEVGDVMGRYTVRELRRRNIDVRLETRLDSCEERVAVLSDGSRHPTRTLVWTAGVKPHPVLAATDLPLTARGRLACTARLTVEGVPHAWGAGDAASVPDISATKPADRTATGPQKPTVTPPVDPSDPRPTGSAPSPSAPSSSAEAGLPTDAAVNPRQPVHPFAPRPPATPATTPPSGTAHTSAAADGPAHPDQGAPHKRTPPPVRPEVTECAPNAQHAVRQAKVLADNVVASLRGLPLQDYEHTYAGSVASLGLHKGVAHVYGRKLKGYPAWLMHRAYHLSRVPTVNRKARVLAEWTLSGLFKREIVSLGSLEHPRAEFELAAGSKRPKESS